MKHVVELVQSVVAAPLAIDSSVVPALIAGIKAAKGRPIVNSVTGEEERMESILPVVAEFDLPVIAITSDERGILFEAEERFRIAKKIVERAATYGIKPEDVLVDPLAMPVSSVATAGTDVFAITHMVKEELGCNTVCGASNISFGLPNRHAINSAFVAMAMATGMTCAITNPLEETIRQTIYAADVLMGHDEYCMNYVTAMRKAAQAK
jgi:5-methyltetrahydrofolate--homocysteine methyltransferase